MEQDVVVVIDCGSTNITVSAVDDRGRFVASSSVPNAPSKQPGNQSFIVWDFDALWDKICQASREVCAKVSGARIKAVTTVTFGADGAFIDKSGNLVYPVISWQCTRTEETAEKIAGMLSPREIYDITGYTIIRFNTLLRFIWLRDHAPEVFDRADAWLMTPGLISLRLSGERSIDSTSAGTMMALDMRRRTWSDKMLALSGMDGTFFPRWVEPGDIIGTVTAKAAEETSLPKGTPVVAGGHDTQFALIGSGARTGEAVLSSGTWEILLVRTPDFKPNDSGFDNGLIFECDAVPGMWNPQLLMMGSGVLEWVRKHFYSAEDSGREGYEVMMTEAENVPPGSNNLFFCPTFVPGTGPLKKYATPGYLMGITVMTSRGEVYRSALEGLSFQMKAALDVTAKATGFSPKSIRVVGGGAKNSVWNRIRADVAGLPVTVTSQTEITALGAALFCFIGTGRYSSIEEAQGAVAYSEKIIEPSGQGGKYGELFDRFMKVPGALKSTFQKG